MLLKAQIFLRWKKENISTSRLFLDPLLEEHGCSERKVGSKALTTISPVWLKTQKKIFSLYHQKNTLLVPFSSRDSTNEFKLFKIIWNHILFLITCPSLLLIYLYLTGGNCFTMLRVSAIRQQNHIMRYTYGIWPLLEPPFHVPPPPSHPTHPSRLS